MKQETSSAIDEAALSMNGCGIKEQEEPLSTGLALLKKALTPSYVVKKAPAAQVRQWFQISNIVLFLHNSYLII
jgi:hypothetical protein